MNFYSSGYKPSFDYANAFSSGGGFGGASSGFNLDMFGGAAGALAPGAAAAANLGGAAGAAGGAAKAAGAAGGLSGALGALGGPFALASMGLQAAMVPFQMLAQKRATEAAARQATLQFSGNLFDKDVDLLRKRKAAEGEIALLSSNAGKGLSLFDSKLAGKYSNALTKQVMPGGFDPLAARFGFGIS